jgi:phosphoglycolate phosphatase
MIGDRHFDILAARANGIRSVGVTWGFADENEFSDAAPDYIVDSPAELLRLFT